MRFVVCSVLVLLIVRCSGVRAEDFLLEDLANYSYLSYGNVSVPQVDDADMFKQTNEAFRIMGITPEEVTGTRYACTPAPAPL